MNFKTIVRWLLAGFMMFAGVMHFVAPKPFISIVPRSLPKRKELVLISGFFEILGGVGLLIPRVRRAAGMGLIALYIAVFPANINMAIKNMPIMGKQMPFLLWLRLPFQFLFMWVAWWVSKKDE